jgi:hypothetical protein
MNERTGRLLRAVAVLLMFVCGYEARPAAIFFCYDACFQSSDCDQECTIDGYTPTTCGEWGTCAPHSEAYCGDGMCTSWVGENCATCADDCGGCPQPRPAGIMIARSVRAPRSARPIAREKIHATTVNAILANPSKPVHPTA